MRVRIEPLGRRDYLAVWQAMRDYTVQRGPESLDRLWTVEHPPVYTLGRNGRRDHLLVADQTPLVESDRGGQITWHGPGQAVVYTLIDLSRRRLGVRALVTLLEQSVVDLLASHGIEAQARADAPGVYVGAAKIASLGLRVTRGCCYHGISLNVDNALEPFARIDPCGQPGLAVTRLADLGVVLEVEAAGLALAEAIATRLETSYPGVSATPPA